MTTMKLTTRFFLAIALAALATGCDKAQVPDASETARTKLTFQMHWIPDVHQLGFWTAVDKGIYRSYGLDVTVQAGGLDANPIKDVLSGAADIGQVGGVEQVAVAVAEGLPVTAVAAIHRESPHALISLLSNPIRGPSDLTGKTIAVAYGDTAEVLLKTYMRKAGIDQSSVTLVPFKYDLTGLLAGQVDAITGFSTAQPATIEKLGQTPVVLSYAAAGVSSYGYTLLTSNATLEAKPEAIAAFLKASREGWEYAFSHPEEAITLMKDRFGDAIDGQLAARELELIRPLMLNEAGQLASWKIQSDRLIAVLEYLRAADQLRDDVTLADIYDNTLTQ